MPTFAKLTTGIALAALIWAVPTSARAESYACESGENVCTIDVDVGGEFCACGDLGGGITGEPSPSEGEDIPSPFEDWTECMLAERCEQLLQDTCGVEPSASDAGDECGGATETGQDDDAGADAGASTETSSDGADTNATPTEDAGDSSSGGSSRGCSVGGEGGGGWALGLGLLGLLGMRRRRGVVSG